MVSFLPPVLLEKLGQFLGWCWYNVVRIRRDVATKNIELCLPGASRLERARIARKCFDNLCISVMELSASMWPWGAKRLMKRVEVQGEQNLQDALSRGKGVIVVTAHKGNWDLAAISQAARGYDIYILTKTLAVETLDRIWNELRSKFGIKLVPDRGSTAKLFEILENNSILVLMVDQHEPRTSGVKVDFLGRKAWATAGPALLARRTGSPVLPVFASRLPSCRHLVTIGEPLHMPQAENVHDFIVQGTAAVQRAVQEAVLEGPEDWLWLHRRWKAGAGKKELESDFSRQQDH